MNSFFASSSSSLSPFSSSPFPPPYLSLLLVFVFPTKDRAILRTVKRSCHKRSYYFGLPIMYYSLVKPFLPWLFQSLDWFTVSNFSRPACLNLTLPLACSYHRAHFNVQFCTVTRFVVPLSALLYPLLPYNALPYQ